MEDNMMKAGEACGSHGCESKGCCRCFHHKVPALMVLLIGLLFLGRAMGWVAVSTVEVGWPLLLSLGALIKLGGGKCKCC